MWGFFIAWQVCGSRLPFAVGRGERAVTILQTATALQLVVSARILITKPVPTFVNAL